ncbi:hypothetical protein LR48_Vigan04g251400 [Vigna angularis]|uniref:Uncharacterized protein n=1 Tax=Phaseolus angularis TaxID=3914 RepID=A0A0L9UHZ1_PHAAN|nr:hypothetical protein LR48_Vigan04g251400 [Vigna angularis]
MVEEDEVTVVLLSVVEDREVMIRDEGAIGFREWKVAAVLVEAPWWFVDAPARKEGDDVLAVATTCGIGGSGGSGTAMAARGRVSVGGR